MYELAEQGVGILFVSSEMPEVLGVSDRILVMRQGQIVANLKRSDATEEKLLRLALPTSVGVA
jgi:ABC-type sugar transport system ATPase subunit